MRELAASGVLEVSAYGPGEPRLLIELPHGATRRSDYDALHGRLRGALPADLDHFFHVNTDIGSPECAHAIAEALADVGIADAVLRCLVPRTCIDCNRVVTGSVPGKLIDGLTPAVAAYIEDDDDRALLDGLHRAYHERTDAAYRRVCGAGGRALQLHSYAPRSVGVERVDAGIVAALHRAYEPEVYATWPERPAVDVICDDLEGQRWADPALVTALRAHFAAIGVAAEENATYRLHPATMGFQYARAYPQQVLCVELSRGLLADPFVPFAESPISPESVRRMSGPLVRTLAAALT